MMIRSVILILLLFFTILLPAQEVQFLLTHTAEYCGGAEPMPEVLEALGTPRPLQAKRIHLRKGTTNKVSQRIIVTITSNENGVAVTSLPPGVYCVVDDDKKDCTKYREIIRRFSKPHPSYGNLNKICLKEWLQTPVQVIEVKPGANTFTINFHQRCSWHSVPCAPYEGSLPP